MSRVFLPLQAFNKPTPVRCLSCGHKWVAQPGDKGVRNVIKEALHTN